MKLGNGESGVLRCDPAKLIDTRLLVQGSSGSGKSWLIRLFCERMAKTCPLVVLDLEGEFVTLREKVDLVIAGDGGELAVDVRSAGLLARKLLELRLSAVVDLFDLTWPQRRAYVRSFLEAMMAAPRDLWGPRLVVVDEAHQFAPESSKSEALGAVIDVASRGRKRGYCLAVATQRVSKLHKDVAAETRNVLIGQTTLDVDVKRALDVLGMPADLEHKRTLRNLDHEFYAMGPALSCSGVELFQADTVATTHPETGGRRDLSPPAPSQKIARVLSDFVDLPEQAEEEAKNLADAKRQIAELRRQVKKPETVRDEKAIARAVADRDRHWRTEVAKIEKARDTLAGRIAKASQLLHVNGEASVTAEAPPAASLSPLGQSATPRPAPTGSRSVDAAPRSIGKSHQLILDTLAYYESVGDADPGWERICALAARHPNTKTMTNARGELRRDGLLEECRLTDQGRALARVSDAVLTIDDLHAQLRSRLKGFELKIFNAVAEAGGRVNQAELTESFGIHPNTKTFTNARGRLAKTFGVIRYEGRGDEREIVGTDLMYPDSLA